MSEKVYEKLVRCYECVRERTDFKPLVALILGSGLGDYAQSMRVETTVSYNDIEGFPVSTVPGHKGQFVFGYVEDVPVVCMQGRVHFYEGYQVSDVVLPTRLMHMLGAKFLFLTNASGGINSEFKAGDLMMLTDHISLFAPNPLIGPNIEELGTRFPDMSHVYEEKLQDLVRETAKELSIDLKEGIYAQLTGPSFESPAEIQMLKKLGTDAVGMSTVVEAISANHCGMRILAISCVCNMAAGISPTPLTHEEVQQAAMECAPLFKKLVTGTIIKIGKLADE
ncbi:MAG: purine-nucleoside phosphorylase [Lachnospiraceae bacterium]|nr:purine-nucleoside phosphorylase [Lachnospiraceae bacterium]